MPTNPRRAWSPRRAALLRSPTKQPTELATLDSHIQGVLTAALQELGCDAPCPALSAPPRPEMGDLCLPCFPLAKALRQAPPKIASALVAKLQPDAVVETFTAQGPYLNLRLRSQALASAVLGQILRPPSPGARVSHTLIEFSSPNTNKPQHLGHIRNNILGDATARILEHSGRKVTRVNLINDRGIHICKSMLAYQKLGQGETPQSSGIKGDHLVGHYYVRFETAFREEYGAWLETPAARARFERWQHEAAGKKARNRRSKLLAKAEKQIDAARRQKLLAALPELWDSFKSGFKDGYFNELSALGGEARAMLLAWEKGDPEVRQLWETMNGWVFDGFDQTYARLGISFDHIDKESQTYLLGKSLVDEGLERGIFSKLDNGAVGCELEKIGLKGTKVLLRADGTSVYMTQDLGTAVSRYEKFGAERMVYVVADEQNYHFQVLFGILALLRAELKGACKHLSYGMVNLPSGKMKSREGTVVDADDLLDELQGLAADKTRERWPELPPEQSEARARTIGLAALKYFILSVSPSTTMLFDPAKSIEFTGDTGPYLLYAYARTRSIFEKAELDFAALDFEPEVLAGLGDAEERALLASLYNFPAELRRAADELDPSRVAAATYAVARSFSAFYYDRDKHDIVGCTDPGLRRARLQLTKAVGVAVRRGLELLGIPVLERM